MARKIYHIIRNIINHICVTHRFKEVGRNTYIRKPMRIEGGKYITFGEDCVIMDGARVEAIDSWSTGQKFQPEILIGNRVSAGQGLHITAANRLVIGDDVLFAPRVMITDIDHQYADITMNVLDQPLIQRTTKVGSKCFVGIGAVLQAGTILGDNCIVGSNAVVLPGIYPDGSVIVGNPGRIVKHYDVTQSAWIK